MKILNNILFYVLITIILISCSSKNEKKEEHKKEVIKTKSVKRVPVIKVDSPHNGDVFTIGDKVDIKIGLKNTDIKVDSLLVLSGEHKTSILPGKLKYNWDTEKLKTGTNQIKIFAYSKGDKIDSYYLKLKLKSDIKPGMFECKIVNTYPHDKKAYTQGLIYDEGVLYEGTGDWANSSLRKVKLETGEILAILGLGNGEYFGEGITLFNDKIIQLTWTSRIGFVYDKKNFKLLTTLEYPTQGWGITTDGEKLIMSDGSNTIHFLDPEYFNEIGKIEVYDNNGAIQNLNELEYVDGIVYANVWQTEEIIAFDPLTGKVLKRIDCRKVVPEGYHGENNNVLNGIAYDKENDRIFITGKRWPSLFEVKFIKLK